MEAELKNIQSTSIMKSGEIVNSIIIKQVEKLMYSNVWILFMTEFEVIVNSVIINHPGKQNCRHI